MARITLDEMRNSLIVIAGLLFGACGGSNPVSDDGGPGDGSDPGDPGDGTVAGAGLMWPDGIEPGDPSTCEAPSGKRCWWVDAAAAAGGDGSFAAPYRSFEAVEVGVRGGDVIYARGRFAMANDSAASHMTLELRGQAGSSAQAPTTLKSWRGSPRAIFDGNRRDGQLRASASGGVRFQNLEITNFGDQGLVVSDGVLYAELVNIVAHDGAVTQSSGIGGAVVLYEQDSLHDFTVRNSLFYNTTTTFTGGNVGALSLISEPTAFQGSKLTVRDNVFHDNFVAVRQKHAGRVHMEAFNNLFHDNFIAFMVRTFSADLHHNVITNHHMAVWIYTDTMNANHEYWVRHNTVYATDWLVAADPDQGGFINTAHIDDNIVVQPTTERGMLSIGDEDFNAGSNDISMWTMSHNVFFYAPPSRDFIYGAPPAEALRKDFTASKVQLHDTSSVFGDPLFHDASGGDFTLDPGSPAIGAGTNGTTPGA